MVVAAVEDIDMGFRSSWQATSHFEVKKHVEEGCLSFMEGIQELNFRILEGSCMEWNVARQDQIMQANANLDCTEFAFL